MQLPDTLINVIHQFSKLPGVGEKTATRQSLFLSTLTPEQLMAFGQSITALVGLRKCDDCGMFCEQEESLCKICTDPKRQEVPILCVVENVTDAMAIQRSGQFMGKLHILGGVLNPLLGIGPDDLFIQKLIERVREQNISEIILAVNPSVEGDATCSYIRELLHDEVSKDLVVDRIGFGIPIGGNLEYLDSLTISKALENRRRI